MLISHKKESYFAELSIVVVVCRAQLFTDDGSCIMLPSFVVTYDRFLRCAFKLPDCIF